ncbi:FMN-dependent alpha-hydroxy acid dehydrogenase [Xylariaceae sp. FL1019]|nr:FMN-dependent alpha-hydroxy acid dehydrogenase [Xylariaceae sp. FL1019]
MKYSLTVAALATMAEAARPYLEVPDTGYYDAVDVAAGMLPDIESIVGLNDFQLAAENYLPITNFTYYRNGAGGEWSYRNNLEVYNRFRFSPRVMNDITGVGATAATTILGHNFSSPIFISPAARADYAHPDAELNLVRAAGAQEVLYITSSYAAKAWEDIAAEDIPGQVRWQQVYFSQNATANLELLARAEATNASAAVWAVDSPGSPSRERAARFGVGSANTAFVTNTWDVYATYRNSTKLPIVLKGIQSVKDARAAVDHGVPAIILSNHGGRNLDGSPSSLEVALEIYQEDPDIFNQIEVLADGGVRYGTDALKLMALGVKAVGIGRPAMFSNVYGQPGVEKMLSILKEQIVNDAAGLGVADLKKINASYVKWQNNGWYS